MASGIAIAATLTGTNNGDTINGTGDADTIDGRGGGDTIDGRAGKDTIEGGDGRDTIRGGNDDDEIYGGNKQGSIADGGNVIEGESGNDTVRGGSGADELHGGDGVDILSAGPLEETAVDTVYGEAGNDTIFAANFPASRDVVHCGTGTDKVIADSLDEVSNSCEEVERIQEEEPEISDGIYQLVPDPNSECDLGEGSFTIGNDPETGERGVEVELGGQVSPENSAVQACVAKIDYETTVSAQGEVSAQSTNTRKYTGTKPSQGEIDEATSRAQQYAEEETATSSSRSGDVTAQYAWRTNTARVTLQTIDPIFLVTNETYGRNTWWNNGYDVDYYSRGKYCWPYQGRLSTWYVSYCPWGDWWYNYDSYRSWIGSDVGWTKYYNWDFGNDNQSTRVYHHIRIWGYQNGGYGYRYQYEDYGEFYWLLSPRVFASPVGNATGP